MLNIFITVMLVFPLEAFSRDLPDQNKKELARDCKLVACASEECGCKLLEKGWKLIASCSGHQWSYLVQKENKRMLCKGIHSRGGLSETDCEPFKGDKTEFEKCDSSPRKK